MRNCIITPTFEGHFCYIGNYLYSFEKNVVDATSIPIAFILSNAEEVEKIQPIIEPYLTRLNIQCYNIEEIFQFYGVYEKSNNLLKKYGGRSYQTLKKIYSMLYIESERFFVLDSESAWIAKTNMTEEFDRFFNSPFIIVSNWETRQFKNARISAEMEEHYAVANYVVGKPMEKFFFEHFMWFYSKELINELCDSYGYPYELIQRVYQWEDGRKAKKEGLMEVFYVMNYIYENREKYAYRIIQVESNLVQLLGNKEFEKYVKHFFTKYRGGRLGIVEFPCDMLTNANYRGIIEFFRQNGLIVSRCDGTTLYNRRIQKEFITCSGVKILAVSQEHVYMPDITKHEAKERIISYTGKELIFNTKVLLKKVLKI